MDLTLSQTWQAMAQYGMKAEEIEMAIRNLPSMGMVSGENTYSQEGVTEAIQTWLENRGKS